MYKKSLKWLIPIFFISYLVELKFPYQEHLMKTINEFFLKIFSEIILEKDSKNISEKEIFDEKLSKVMPENDWKNKNLKGKVKTMTEITYKYGYSGKDNEVKKIVTKFNENGYIIEKLQYIQNREDPYSYKYKYNKKGLLIESNEYTYTYKYDKEGNLVQIKRQKIAYETIEKTIYNKDGKLIRNQLYDRMIYPESRENITNDNINYFKDENGKLYGRLTDYSYIYDKDGKLQEIRDNIFSSGTSEYIYEEKNGLYVETIEYSTQKFVTYYDGDGNEVYYMWLTHPSKEYEPLISLYLVFKDRKRDKYGNLTYQVANRIEMKIEDLSIGKGNDMGIYEKKIIEYEYYE